MSLSSAEEDFNDAENAIAPDSKKRRVQRACDTCRRKKIRCDGSHMPGNRCSNCIAYGLECTYVEAAKKRGPPKGYVESLENRLEKMEKLLQKVCPDADFSRELGGGRIDRESWQRSGVSAPAVSCPASYGGANTPIEDLVPSDDEDILTLRLSESLKSMNIQHPRRQMRFFGKSSGVMLIQKAIDLKKEFTGSDEARFSFLRPLDDIAYPWELAVKDVGEPKYMFPDEELGAKLVHIYFTFLNPLAPLLHRPSFERKIAQGMHLRNASFGAVYLLVCATASRYSDDPRVILDNVESGISAHSAGWKYFEQVQIVRRTLLGPPCLEDLQIYCLSSLFLQGTSAPQACWTIVGIGIRIAQDVGAHRRKSYNEKLTVEGELWKRAFWVLVVMDRQMSSSLGRPCAIQDEDFDLDFPVDCDDEYWEHPDTQQTFKQPPDKPSSVAFFNCFLKLYNILSFAHRTIYSINKSKILLGFVGQQWEQHIVAELDSSLNKWIDEVPDHLRWDPTRDAGSIFFMQSTALYANYYHVQIFIHRPFIPTPRKPSPLSFPSLAICTNAARSCSHVIDIYRKRTGAYASFLQMHAFTAGIVLLLNIWGGKRSGLSTDPVKEMADVHKCMGVLKSCESRWHSAGRLWDILYELASVGDLPLPQPSPQGGTKREREDSVAMAPRRPPTPKGRAMVGTRRVSREMHVPAVRQAPTQQQQQQLQAYSLPVYSDDLGRLPLHGHGQAFSTGASNVWYTNAAPSSVPTSAPTSTPAPTSAPATTSMRTTFSSDAYAIDELFMEPMGQFAGYVPTQHGIGAGELQALMGATVGVPSMMSAQAAGTQSQGTTGMSDAEIAAMWSSAPAGFGVTDWGLYLSSVVNAEGQVHGHSVPGL